MTAKQMSSSTISTTFIYRNTQKWYFRRISTNSLVFMQAILGPAQYSCPVLNLDLAPYPKMLVLGLVVILTKFHVSILKVNNSGL